MAGRNAGGGMVAMSGIILAVPDRPEAAPRVLAAASCMAELTRSARVNVLAIRTPPISTILPTENVLTADQERRIRDSERQRADALKRIFDGWSRGAMSLKTEWIDVEELADEAVSEWGRRADFIVLQRPPDHPT